MKELDRLAPPGTPERAVLDGLNPACLPRHVAIIMDGNGRWARQRGLARVEGHRAGIKAVREAAEAAARLELDVLTIYAFSTENWKRPSWEVRTLMGLLREYLQRELDILLENGIRLRPIGRLEALDSDIQEGLARAVEATRGGKGLVLQIALNYSGRAELQGAFQQAARLAAQGELRAEEIDERWIASQLLTAGLADPDLLIRTSGELRISNFLLWQIAYSELYFTPVLWPDFRAADLIAAVADYARRERRYGGVLEGAPMPEGEGS